MKNSKVTVFDRDISEYDGDLLIFFAAQKEDESIECDSRIKKLIQPLVKCKDFLANEQEYVVLYPSNTAKEKSLKAKRIVVFGLGKKEQQKDEYGISEMFRAIGGALSQLCEKMKVTDVMIDGGRSFGYSLEMFAESLMEGLVLGDYRFVKYKNEDKDKPFYPGLKKIRFVAREKIRALREGAKKGAQAAIAACSARDMANEPGNGWTASHFAKHAEHLAKQYDLECNILDKAKIKRLGMGGIIAVNQGSSEPPKLVILEYIPEKKGKTIMLVGKGLTFDSGGVSIKPSAGMQDMKYDMCGGAAVLAAMQAIAESKPAVHVVALIPATDNMPGGAALKPGDVITHYNGITSEIISTDAEGRLILADAIAYGIKQYKPNCVVDVATLTGAVIMGLGHHYTGILGNDDKLVEELIEAGRKSGEPLWRLPLGKEYTKQIESKVADIKNTGGRPAGTITAAAFLEKFVGDVAWAHLDIAGTAWDFTEKSYIPKGPSGIAVRTLVNFVRSKG